MPPAGGIAEGINSFTDEVRVLGCQFFCVEACDDAEEGEISLNVFTPMVLAQTPTKDVIKLCLRLG